MITTETKQFTVGSSDGCDVKLTHASISRAHLKIYFVGDSVLIEDLNSRTGTFVFYNGEYKRVKSAKIKFDTKIRIGDSLEAVEVGEIIAQFNDVKALEKKDLFRHMKVVGLKRCGDCASVIYKEKIYCECCGTVLEEAS
jgi:pSer/pThr/pTyr-binding forkhead associated (FHA) protein